MSDVIITGIFTLIGVLVGGTITGWYEKRKELRANKINAYVKLVGCKLPLVQSIQTNVEAQLLCEYYEARAYIQGSNNDIEEAKIQNERMLSLIHEVTKQRSNLSKTIAEVRISFRINEKTDMLLDLINNGESLAITSVVNRYNTIDELDRWKDSCYGLIKDHLKRNYNDPLYSIINDNTPPI